MNQQFIQHGFCRRVIFACLVAAAANATNTAIAGYPARIQVGDPASESAAKLFQSQSIAGEDDHGQSFRRLNKDGKLTFELACDPSKPNYLTVRLNGSEANRNYLYVVQPDGNKDVFEPKTEERWGDLDHDSETPPFPGRYYYSTYALPAALTRGKTSVRLTIESRGNFEYYGGHIQDEQTSLGKAIYVIAVHTDPYYFEKDDDKLGAFPVVTEAKQGNGKESAGQYLRKATLQSLRELLSWQVYGPAFDKAVAFSPGFPTMLKGAVVTHMNMTDVPAMKDRQGWSQQQWLDSMSVPAVTYQNWCTMMAVNILGDTYVYPWSGSYRRSPEILDRMFSCLDFWCHAQALGGEFAIPEDGPNKGKWIGAAVDHSGKRGSGYNWDLQANGVPSLAEGFVTVYNDITSRNDPVEVARLNGLLDAKVDNDNVGRPTVTRRVALAQMYSRARDFFASKGGKDYFDPNIRNPTPSQGFNIETLYSVNRALQLLQASLASSKADHELPRRFAPWPTGKPSDALMRMLTYCFGTMADGERWFSGQPDGVSYEGGASSGGYDGNYGMGMQNGLDSLARLTEGDARFHELVVTRLKAVLAGNAHIYRRESVDGKPVLTADYIMAARNIFNCVKPAYSVETYAADVLNDPFALRRFMLFDRDGQALQKKTDDGPFWYYQMREMQTLCNSYANLERKVATSRPAPLPMEDAAPDFVWSDTDAQCVVFKNKGEKVYLAFNWRRRPWEINDLARIHILGPMTRRVINAEATHQGDVRHVPASARVPAAEAPNGKYYDYSVFNQMNSVQFGRYIVIQNVSNARTFEFRSPRLAGASNLATGETLTGGKLNVKPRSTYVLFVNDSKTGGSQP